MRGLACHVCGAAAAGPGTRRRTHSHGGRPTPASDYDVGTCADCLALRPEEPGVAVRAALRVLGREGDDWRLAAEAFEDAGVDATMALYDRGGPQADRGVRGPQARPFHHVDGDAMAALRSGYARLLDFRVHAASGRDRPVPPHAPPEGAPRACLACGLGLSAQWHGPVRTKALTRGPDFVEGYVCPACAGALEAVGAVGPGFLERACMEASGREWSAAVRLPGLRAWVALDAEPREVPWDWVGLRDPEPVLSLEAQVAALAAKIDALEARP